MISWRSSKICQDYSTLLTRFILFIPHTYKYQVPVIKYKYISSICGTCTPPNSDIGTFCELNLSILIDTVG
jgi:hypothetical protein